MEAKTKTMLVGVGIGVLAYMLINKRNKTIVEVKSKAEGNDDLANTSPFAYMDGEFYNADGDFYGADGNFYDADGTFVGNDGEFEGVGEDEHDTMSFADGESENERSIKVGKSKTPSLVRALAIWKEKLVKLNASKKRLTSQKNIKPEKTARLDNKIKQANYKIARIEQRIKSAI